MSTRQNAMIIFAVSVFLLTGCGKKEGTNAKQVINIRFVSSAFPAYDVIRLQQCKSFGEKRPDVKVSYEPIRRGTVSKTPDYVCRRNATRHILMFI